MLFPQARNRVSRTQKPLCKNTNLYGFRRFEKNTPLTVLDTLPSVKH